MSEKMPGFATLKQECEEALDDEVEGQYVPGDISDVTTEDWQRYLQTGSSRCFKQYCDKNDRVCGPKRTNFFYIIVRTVS